MNTLHATFDPRADAAYVYLRDIGPGGSARQHLVECPDFAGTIILDLDHEGRLIGIEILGATAGLPGSFLAQAEVLD